MPEFDLEDRFSFYKGTTDNLIVGPARPTLGSSIWQRCVSGSAVSGSQEFKASVLASDYLFKTTRPYARSGNVKFVRIASATQTIRDSVPPSIFALYVTGSIATATGSYIVNTGLHEVGLECLKLLFASDGQPVTASGGTQINNTEWTYSFPFEKKYENVPYFTDMNLPVESGIKENVSNFTLIGNTLTMRMEQLVIGTTVSGVLSGGHTTRIYYFYDSNGYYKETPTSFQQTGFTGSFANPLEGAKLVFGINPKPMSFNDSAQGVSDLTRSYCTGSTIEGWRYGLYNGVPTNFTAVFRRDKYGQIRDMLEPRMFTKTFNNPEVGGLFDAEGGINFISASALSGEFNEFLSASVYGSTDVTNAYVVNPYGSGIYDKEYRASQPWHDDDRRLR